MTKKSKIVLSVFFWIFIFVTAFLMILFLPRVFFKTNLYDEVNASIQEDNYSKTLELMELYFDTNPVYEDSKVKIFTSSSKKKVENKVELSKNYVCIIKNVDKLRINGKGENKSEILLNSSYSISILSIDSDNDEVIDSVDTLVDYDFIYFNIPYQCVNSVETIQLIDREGISIVSCNPNLSFTESFFTDITSIENAMASEANVTEVANSFLALSSTYGASNTMKLQQKAYTKVFVIMLIFSVIILVLYDATLGMHFTWIPFKKLYKKYFIKKEEVIELPKYQGNSKVTIQALVPDGYIQQIKITGKGEKEDHSFDITLRKSNGYKMELKLPTDRYSLTSNNTVKDLPEVLVVESYFTTLNLKINEGGSSDGSNITTAK